MQVEMKSRYWRCVWEFGTCGAIAAIARPKAQTHGLILTQQVRSLTDVSRLQAATKSDRVLTGLERHWFKLLIDVLGLNAHGHKQR